jgi:hypothetical protein
MRTIIAGSRDIWVRAEVWKAIEACGHDITEVVCGEARGVDALGKAWAFENGVPVKSFPANWDKYGKAAGAIRNEAMVAYAQAAIVIWDGASPGSADMIRRAERANLKLHIHRV